MKNTIVLYGFLFLFTMLSLSVFGQEALNDEQAQALKNQGIEAWLNHQYTNGLNDLNRALKYYEKTANRTEIADILNMITLCHIGLEQADRAFYYFEKVIPAYSNVNSGLTSTLLVTGQIAQQYQLAGKWDASIKQWERTIELAEAFGVVEYISIAVNKLGEIHHTRNEYRKALGRYEEGLRLVQQMQGEMADLAQMASYMNIGRVFLSWGRYDQAVQSFQNGMSIARRYQNNDYMAALLYYTGRVYEEWGSYDKALDYFRQAAASVAKTDNVDLMINIENSTANIYVHKKEYSRALTVYEQVLGKAEQHKLDRLRPTALNNIAFIYGAQGRNDEALKTYKQALELYRLQNNEYQMAIALNNIGVTYLEMKNGREALNYYEQALNYRRKLGDEPGMAGLFNDIGAVYCELLDFDRAIPYFGKALEIKEKLRKTASGAERRDYLASQIYTYQYLTKSNFDAKRFGEAFKAIEAGKAKQLAELLTGSDEIIPISVQQIQAGLPRHAAALSYSLFSGGTWNTALLMVMDNEGLQGSDIELRNFLKSTGLSHGDGMQKMLAGQRGMKKISAPREEILRTKTRQDSLENIVNYYRGLLMNPSPENLSQAKELGRKFYDWLIKPVSGLLQDKRELIIIPDGVLGVLPFETLLDESGQYLIEKYDIRYVHSMTVLDLIKKRAYPGNRKSLIAFGGPVYDEITYAVDMVQNDAQFSALQNDVYSAIASRGALNEAYAGLGFAQWSNLPGTLQEVNEIAKTVSGTMLVTGPMVTEDLVKAMSGLGELAKYKVIHFATHGLALPELPELSALVFSQLKNKPGSEDGYLRTDEIAALKLNADFVNLSACETGLGKIYGGEGVVGLTQSFLIAGANALSVSLWQVSDVSTSRFMTGLYDLARHNGPDYLKAMTEMKRKFISGEFGEQYRAPYYWAPFVYYGM